jgi:hypothetical protein
MRRWLISSASDEDISNFDQTIELTIGGAMVTINSARQLDRLIDRLVEVRSEVYGDLEEIDVDDLLDRTLCAIDVLNDALHVQGVEIILQYVPKSSIH